MDIPSLMLVAAQEGGSFIEQSIKELKVKPKEKEKELLNVWLELNCDEKLISFRPFAYQKSRSEKQFHYLGNNASAASQIYVVRDVNSFLNYWICRMNGIFMNILNFLPEPSLKDKLEICRQNGLFDENGLNFEYIKGTDMATGLYQDPADKKKNSLLFGDERMTCEKWLLQVMELSAGQKLMLIVPVIILNGERTVISCDPDYIQAIEAQLAGNSSEEKKGKKKKTAVCHICGQASDSIDTKKYCNNLERSSISKVFVTTPINYAPGFEKNLHQKNFALCKPCYDKWYSAEKKIMKDYRLKIAGEDAVVLVDGIGQRLEIEDLSRIVRDIDAAFNPEKYWDWLTELKKDYLEEQKIELYEFNLLFFETDGKSCAIKKSIEDISSVWFQQVKEEFKKTRMKNDYAEVLRKFDLGSVYGLIPVRKDKKKKQLNINRVFEFYAAMLQKNILESKVIFEYFAEAMECGRREIMSSELRNYENLYCLEVYHRMAEKGGFEWYVHYMCHAYLGLIEILQNLNILRNGVFQMNDAAETKNNSGENITETMDGEKKLIEKMIEEKEEFLDRHGFPDYAKGIYYVGAMMYQVGMMQYHQGHKNKPILDKVSYSGVNQRDIIELLGELHDKVRQYKGAMVNQKKKYLIENTEYLAKQAYGYLGDFVSPEYRELNEHENLFYLMSGYSGCVMSGSKKLSTEAESLKTESEKKEI